MKKTIWVAGIFCLLFICFVQCADAGSAVFSAEGSETATSEAVEMVLNAWEKTYPTDVLMAEWKALDPESSAKMPMGSDISAREALRRSIALILRLQWESVDSLRTFRPAIDFNVFIDMREWVVSLDNYSTDVGSDAYFVHLDALTGNPTRMRRGGEE